MQKLQTTDYVVFLIYFVIVAGYGYWIYNRKKKAHADSKDFFLAEGALTWWAIGASLIASNISAEQFIGMSGSGFKLGLAISAYEWMAAATLLIVAIFFMPVYLKNKIFTMPQFLSQRYNEKVAMIMAVFCLMLYIVINLMSILYLGALAISGISDLPITFCILGLAVFAIIITLGGMIVIGFTDVIQVFFLLLGGLVASYIALNIISGQQGIVKGFAILTDGASEHFHLIFKKDNPNYMDLTGLSVLIGGMWIANLSYWGCNQYITQRALGASLPTARKGLLFAAFLKLLMPLIVVLPGIACYVIFKNGGNEAITQGMKVTDVTTDNVFIKPDNAYSILLNLLPAGLKGLAFAALTAAIVASLAGKANSISTIFSLDIYKRFFNKNATEKRLVLTGRITVIVAMILASLVAPALRNLDQAYQFIQEYVGFISPGVLSIFLLGFFWKRTTSTAALTSAILTIPLSTVLKFLPVWTNGAFPDFPFMDRMTIVFFFLVFLVIVISIASPRKEDRSKEIIIDTNMLRYST